MILASVDRTEAPYCRISNQDGRMFPSAVTKLHRPSQRDEGVAACSWRIVLNDDAKDYDIWSTPGICRRCVTLSDSSGGEYPGVKR